MRLRWLHLLVLAVVGMVLVYSGVLSTDWGPPDSRQSLLLLTETRHSGPSIIYTALLQQQDIGPNSGGGAPEEEKAKPVLNARDEVPNGVGVQDVAGAALPNEAAPPADVPVPDVAAAVEVAASDLTLNPAAAAPDPAPEKLPPPETLPPGPVPAPVAAAISPAALLTRDLYEPGFSHPNPALCKTNLTLLILVTSAPGHYQQRQAIRQTWGHYGQRADVAVGFLIGTTPNATLQTSLSSESGLYADLILANFIDSYDNLTLKTMSSLEWVKEYCNNSEWLLKTDDDMFVGVGNLLAFVGRVKDADALQPKIYGRLAKKWKPVRNKKSKYFISFQQHRKTVYADFTTGPAYLMRSQLAPRLFERGMTRTYLKLEDVYTTGIIASELSIKRVNVPEFANKKVNYHKTGFCALSRLISMHMVQFHEQFELWRRLQDGRTRCATPAKEKV